MSKCTILKWLPWIGKSHRASEQWLVVINKDTIRLENPWIKEDEVRKIQHEKLENLFKSWIDCILDNTHFFPWSLERAIRECKDIWFEVEIKDFMEWVPNLRRKESILRNVKREARVPQSVIDKMYLSNYWISEQTFWKEVFIFDLDWTLANLENRLHYIKTEWQKKDWKWFFKECWNDTVIEPVARMWRALSWPTICKVIVSGRSTECAFETEKWLKDNWFEYDFILMRDERDKRDDFDVKKEIYERFLKGNNIVWVFDDRRRVLDMWQEVGVFTFDVWQWKVY